MRRFAQVMEKFRTTFTYNRPYDVQLLDTFAGASLKELDYINEASNQEEFRKEFLHRLVINFLNKSCNLEHKIFKTMTKKIFISKRFVHILCIQNLSVFDPSLSLCGLFN